MPNSVRSAVRVFVIFGLLYAGAAFSATVEPTGQVVPGEVLVKMRSGVSTEDFASLQASAGVDESEKLSAMKSGTIWRMHSRSRDAASLAAALQASANVVYAEPNYVVHLLGAPNDPTYAQLWGLHNTGQSISGSAGTAGSDINAEAAWDVTTGSASIVVGVVDTGIDYTHPDLAANVWSNPGGKGNVACAAGTHGYNAITKTCDPRDDHYHGTHVSGTIGAVGNNSLGVAGVNWTTSIMALKFLNSSGSGTTADAVAAIDFAVQAKIDGVNVRILSNSWGGGAFSKALLDEINKANENDILFVAAAGNDGANNDISAHYPANYATPNMISVAATDNRDALAYFSDYGVTTVHLGAPGVSTYSTMPGSSYGFLSGTSMATPHVSGVAALLLAQTPSLTTAQVKSAILSNTDPVAALSGKTVTGGRLNAARVLGVPPGPSFTLGLTPPSRTVVRGGVTTYLLSLLPTGGFAASVDLSVTGLPSGVTGVFSPPSTATTSTLTLTTTATTSTGAYSVIVTGTGGGVTRSAVATLNVTSAPVAAPCPSFAYPSSYYSFGSPTAIVAADFDRDGKPDLATANTTANGIGIMLGTGDGAVNSGIYYPTASTPVGLATGDFNRDGKADLAVANSGSHNVSILLGNGNGTFLSAVNYPTGSSPFSVAVADFNGDGNADLAVANNGGSNVSILAGLGDGTFQAAVNYGAGSGAFWVTAGDFNADGRADLAVADFNAAKVSILLGNGDGSFQAAVHYATANGPSTVAIGDFNGDGKSDLAVANFTSNNISVLRGNGDGTFQNAVQYPVANGPYSVTVFDVDGDGKDDLASANSGSDSVSLLRGSGTGTFASAVNYPVSYTPSQVVAADFNRDGRMDLATVNTGYSDVTILRNTGVCSINCSTFGDPVQQAAGTAPRSVTAADFNRDGIADLAVVNNGSNNVSVRLGIGDSSFQVATDYTVGSTPAFVATADVNGDGKVDLLVANAGSGNVSVLLGTTGGAFQGAVHYAAGSNPHAVAVGDFNRDGKLDLAVANNGSDNVSILLGNGTGTFAAAVPYAAGSNPEAVAVGDFNRDGKADLVVANAGSANVSLLIGNGDGTFAAAANSAAGTSPFSLFVDDFNRDGRLDVAVANSGSANVSVLLGNNSGGFQAAVSFAAGTAPYAVAGADLNADGYVDLAVANHGSNNVSILLNFGDGTFSAPLNRPAGTAPAGIAIRDFNRDNKPDLAVANGGSGNVSILLNTCPVPDVSITKTHAGNFSQGDVGRTYTITVTNVGGGPTDGLVTVTEAVPLGLSPTALSGSGWTCTLGSSVCTRDDALAAGASYPPITLTGNVTNAAGDTITNTVTVSGGGQLNTLNDSASDPTTINPATDLIVISKHITSFSQGDHGRTYTLTVRNSGGLPTAGGVTVSDTLPAGLTATNMSGSGWICVLGILTCSRGDALAGNATYPPITLTVNVASSASGLVINTAAVSGGGDGNTVNNTATDPTTIWSNITCASFGAAANYAVGSTPYGLVVSDFNGDGKADVVVSNYYSNSISFLAGDGLGGFAPAVNYAVGLSPSVLAMGDLNNDGKMDLILALSNSSSKVAVMFGNGDGAFAPPATYESSTYATALAVNDFNGDGNLDVAVTDSSYGKVVILLGNGAGALQKTAEYALYNPTHVMSADFDSDGRADLAITNYYDGKVSILRGNGDGTFAAAVAYNSLYSSQFSAAGDFNGDGNLDLAVASSYYGIAILLGNGDATFQSPLTTPSFYGALAIVIDDLNADGKADIAATGSSASVAMLLGNGDGTVQEPVYFNSGNSAYRIAISDFNGDGRADFALTSTYDSRVSIMLGGCSDLTITKTHSGNFTGGQSGYYTITVKNVGNGGSAGTVTVKDFVPSGMTAVDMWGSGWNCTLATTTCTRTDSLSSGFSFSPITLTANIASTAPAQVTNTALVSGGADTNTANNTVYDPTTIVVYPDLTISMTHDGNFVPGQSGKYTITVGNSGGVPTTGVVTVYDSLPFGLSLTSMTGTGWNCNTLTQSCTRTDSLAVNTAYPPITVMVSVQSNAPSTLSNYAYVSGGGESNTFNSSVGDPTRVLAVVTNLVATATLTSQISLTWNAASVASYQVLRSTNNQAFSVIASPSTNSYVDAGLTPNTVYFYRVRVADISGVGPVSNTDYATTTLFTDDPLGSSSTTVKALHLTELRTAVNAMRLAAGLPAATFTDPTLTSHMIRAIHLTELRTALDAARNALTLGTVTYTDSSVSAGMMIKATHIRELRAAVK